jgi:glyoxylase-like metal-dependent hydrolase (beta-lactamase superfamily II)
LIQLQLIHAPGHSADQFVIYQPESKTLWAADMLTGLDVPFVIYDIRVYENTLNMLAELDIQALVPGHGEPTKEKDEIEARIGGDLSYIREMQEVIGEAVRKGYTVQETVELCESIPFRLIVDRKMFHKLNVESAYLLLGGKADPTEFGWDRNDQSHLDE